MRRLILLHLCLGNFMNLLNDGPVSARDICERRIDATAQAILSGDFDAFAEWFGFPYEFETFDVARRIANLQELRESFDRVHRHYVKLGVTQLERRCIEAEFRDKHTMNSTHESRVLRGNELLLEPYPTFSVSRFIDGRWRVVKSSHAIVDQPAFVLAVLGDG